MNGNSAKIINGYVKYNVDQEKLTLSDYQLNKRHQLFSSGIGVGVGDPVNDDGLALLKGGYTLGGTYSSNISRNNMGSVMGATMGNGMPMAGRINPQSTTVYYDKSRHMQPPERQYNFPLPFLNTSLGASLTESSFYNHTQFTAGNNDNGASRSDSNSSGYDYIGMNSHHPMMNDFDYRQMFMMNPILGPQYIPPTGPAYDIDRPSLIQSVENKVSSTLPYIQHNRYTHGNEDPNSVNIHASNWTRLDMKRNGIYYIVPALFDYTFLTALDLSHNLITIIPPEISNLKHLTALNLAGNKISELPNEIGDLLSLQKMSLYGNNLTSLPYTMGKLVHLQMLNCAENPLQEPFLTMAENSISEFLAELLECCEYTEPAPDRIYIELNSPSTAYSSLPVSPATTEPGTINNINNITNPHFLNDKQSMSNMQDNIFKVMTYNILSDKFTDSAIYRYCPSWALAWEYRRDLIFSEITEYAADIVCLQEVKSEDFYDIFQPTLLSLGYKGVFVSKAANRMQTEQENKEMDGCATFYKETKLELISDHTILFNSIALNYGNSTGSDMFDRVMPRENVALVTAFKSKYNPVNTVCVTNVHIYWNPEFPDVKLIQTIFMIDEVKKFLINMSENGAYNYLHLLPVIFCGDFNSLSTSGVHELLSRGSIDKDHNDLKNTNYGNFLAKGYKSPFKLDTAYHDEMPFTNYTLDFKGVVDYIWYSKSTLTPLGILGAQPESFFEKNVACPNPYIPSDHLPLFAEFEWKPTSS